MRVSIIGSCVSRDAFELPRAPGIMLDMYFARSSLASACSDRIVEGVDVDAIESPFQRRIVAMDLDKSFLDYVASGRYEVLIYDPIDERFDLVDLDGALATRSNELLRARLTLAGARVIPSGTDEFFSLWERGWELLIRSLDAAGKRTALRVNQVYWAAESVPEGGLAEVATTGQIARANEFLDRLYRRMRVDLHPEQVYVYDPRVFVADASHRWGLSPFHYVPEFYAAFVRNLEREAVSGAIGLASPCTPWHERRYETTFPTDEVDLGAGADATAFEDRVHSYKSRHIVYTVHARPRSRRLVFVFSGVDAVPGTTRMSYFRLGSSLDATVVHVKDGSGAHGSYLLSVSGDRQVRNAVLSLVRALQAEFDVPGTRTWFIGTSKGGTIAIAYALISGSGHVIAGEPQICIGKFVFGPGDGGPPAEWQRSIAYAMLGRVDPSDREVLDGYLPEIVARYGSRFRGSLQVIVGQNDYWEAHVEPLARALADVDKAGSLTVERYPYVPHSGVIPPFVDAVRGALGSPPSRL